MNKLTITDYVKARESRNISDIYIYLTEVYSPIAYGKSALLLEKHFPQFCVKCVLDSDNEEYFAVWGFPIEPVLEKFEGCHQLVEDKCIQFIDVCSQ